MIELYEGFVTKEEAAKRIAELLDQYFNHYLEKSSILMSCQRVWIRITIQ